MAVIVIMAAALFAGAFSAMSNVGGVAQDLDLHPPVTLIKTWGVIAVAGFTLLSLLLSGRMVVRLRIALAEHSQTLSRLRNEDDNPWRFRPHERTYLLFILLHMLASSMAVIVAWSIWGMWVGLLGGAGLMAAGLVWYPVRLTNAARHARRAG